MYKYKILRKKNRHIKTYIDRKDRFIGFLQYFIIFNYYLISIYTLYIYLYIYSIYTIKSLYISISI